MTNKVDTLINLHDTLYVGFSNSVADGYYASTTEWPFYFCFITLFVSLLLFLLYKKKSQKRIERIEQENLSSRETSITQIEEDRKAYDKLALSYLQNCNICREMKEIICKHKNNVNNTPLISAIQIEELQKEINYAHNDFVFRLKETFPNLKPEEIDFCSLVKAGFKYAEIACLLGRTPNMMYKRRKAIVEKLQTTQNNIDSLEMFLSNF